MPALWEREANYHQRRKREEGLTPYLAVRKWRRRAWAAALVAVLEAVLLVLLVRSIHW